MCVLPSKNHDFCTCKKPWFFIGKTPCRAFSLGKTTISVRGPRGPRPAQNPPRGDGSRSRGPRAPRGAPCAAPRVPAARAARHRGTWSRPCHGTCTRTCTMHMYHVPCMAWHGMACVCTWHGMCMYIVHGMACVCHGMPCHARPCHGTKIMVFFKVECMCASKTMVFYRYMYMYHVHVPVHVPCTMYHVPCTMYHGTWYHVPCTMYRVDVHVHVHVPCTVYHVPCTMYRVPCTCTMYLVPCYL